LLMAPVRWPKNLGVSRDLSAEWQLSLRLVPWLVPDRPAAGRCTVHSHVPGWSCGLGGKRGGTVAQHPAGDDLARCPLVPVRAALRVVLAPPVRTLHPHDRSLEHTFEHIYTNRA
jgi:hypothetical protein